LKQVDSGCTRVLSLHQETERPKSNRAGGIERKKCKEFGTPKRTEKGYVSVARGASPLYTCTQEGGGALTSPTQTSLS
jgi:hypothetical protein